MIKSIRRKETSRKHMIKKSNVHEEIVPQKRKIKENGTTGQR